MASLAPMTTNAPKKDTRRGDRHKGPKTRAVRIEDDLWESMKERAKVEGRTINEAVVLALEMYVDRP